MYQLKNVGSGIGRLMCLVGAIALLTPAGSYGQEGPTKDVNVVNTPNVNVVNTPKVEAQQSGTWNVGINGTPTVNIGSAPTITVTGTTALVFDGPAFSVPPFNRIGPLDVSTYKVIRIIAFTNDPQPRDWVLTPRIVHPVRTNETFPFDSNLNEAKNGSITKVYDDICAQKIDLLLEPGAAGPLSYQIHVQIYGRTN